MLSLLGRGAEGRAEVAERIAAAGGDESVVVDPAAAGLPFPRARCARSCSGSRTTSPRPGCWSSTSSRRRSAVVAGFERVPAGRSQAEAARPLLETPDVLRRQPHDGAGRRRGDVVAVATPRSSTSSSSSPACSPSRSSTRRPRRRARRSAAGSCSTTGAPATSRPTTRAQTSSARSSRPRRSPTRSAATSSPPTQCRTGRGDRPRPGRRRAVVRGHDRRRRRTTSARCSPTPPRASGSTPATSSRPARCPAAAGWSSSAGSSPGQTVELEIDGIGTLTNRIDPDAGPRSLP